MTSRTPNSTRPLYRICLCIVLVGLVAAFVALGGRIAAESSSKAVDLVVDYQEMVALAGVEGVSLETVLTRMKASGATAVALQSETVGDLEREGALSIVAYPTLTQSSAPSLPAAWQGDPVYMIRPHTEQAMGDVIFSLPRVYAPESLRVQGQQVIFRGDPDTVRELGLGLSFLKMQRIQQAGLRVVPRLRGGAGTYDLTPLMEVVAMQLEPGHGAVRGVVVFDGTTLPGYRAHIAQLADDLNRHHLVYGAVEFGKQKGDAELSRKLGGRLVRVHSISVEELSTLPPAQAVQRFGLAVKDRNIRVLYVHLPPVAVSGVVPGETTPRLESAAKYVYGIRHEVTSQGFVLATQRPAHPFTSLALTPLALALLFAGAGAGFLLWLLAVLPAQLPTGALRLGYVLVGLLLLAAVGFSLQMASLGRVLFGLLAAVGFPMLALTWAYRRIEYRPRYAPPPLPFALEGLVVATAITMGGALLIAAMLSETPFLVKVGQFTGVKLALAVPLLLFGALIASDGVAREGECLAEYLARCRARLREILWKPVYLWGIAAAVVGLAAVAILLARSGNEGVGVSDLELRFRSMLEQWLIARPRTKEFAFGHPLFIFGMIAGARGQRLLALLLLLGGAIGQVDVLNTYCHAHTPVLLSLLRTVNGLWLGAAVAVAALLLFARGALRRPRDEQPTPDSGA